MNPFRRTIAIKHRAASTIVDGSVVLGVYTDATIQASVQPLKPDEVKNLPEGRRDRSPFWIITDTFLNLASAATPDFVVLDGVNFEIESRESWRNNICNHYIYLVIKTLEA